MSDLARRGFRGTVLADQEHDGLPVFRMPPDAPPITSEDVHPPSALLWSGALRVDLTRVLEGSTVEVSVCLVS